MGPRPSHLRPMRRAGPELRYLLLGLSLPYITVVLHVEVALEFISRAICEK